MKYVNDKEHIYVNDKGGAGGYTTETYKRTRRGFG